MQSLQSQHCFLPQGAIPARTAFTEGNAENAFLPGNRHLSYSEL